MALKLHIGIPESCSEGPAATIALPHQTHDDHGGDEDGWDDDHGDNEDGDLDDHRSPHQTRDDHGDEDEGCLGQDNNECFALKFVMILKKIMITKKKKRATL